MSLLSKNDFEIFELSPCFDLDIDNLTQRYRAMQSAVHPDRFATGSDVERRIAVQLTARVNEAYQNLLSPLSRMRCLLELAGIDVSAQTATMDISFLEQQIELREQLSNIVDLAGLQVFTQLLLKYMADVVDKSRAQYQAGEFAAMHGLYNKLQFLNRLREEATQLEETLK